MSLAFHRVTLNGHLRSLLRTPLSRGIVTLSSFNRSTTASSSSASSSAASIPLFRTSPSPFTLLNTVHQHQPTKSIHAYTKTQAEANETNKQTTTPTPTPTVTPTPTPSAGATASSSASGGAKSGTGGPNSSRGTRAKKLKDSNSNMLQYLFGVAILVVGASWAAIPLYRLFCAHTGYGGTTQTDKDGSKLATLKPGKREVVVSFNADVSPSMHWKFIPSQKHLKIRLGEPVLAFYKATNLRDKAITGVATYNVTPQKSGAYFHKIQCFCFDEQRLRANETVDMPVFFYIDPAMEEDRHCQDVTHLTLSYTFFPVDEDEDDTRSEEEKDAAMAGVRLHGTGMIPNFQLPPGATYTPIPTPAAANNNTPNNNNNATPK